MSVSTDGLDPKQAAMIRAQEALQDKAFATQMAMLDLQRKTHEQQQQVMTLSNLEKAKDDAMKSVINNIK